MCLVFKLVKLEPQNKNRMSFCGLGCSLGSISLLSRVQRGQEQTEICVNDVRFKLIGLFVLRLCTRVKLSKRFGLKTL